MPRFVETSLDGGYMDTHRVMRALHQVEFRGVVIPDHVSRMVGDPRLGTACTIGYMKTRFGRANQEEGKG